MGSLVGHVMEVVGDEVEEFGIAVMGGMRWLPQVIGYVSDGAF